MRAGTELQGSSRDLTAKVNEVRDILPQFSEDQVCLVLADCDENVERAIEVLLSQPEPRSKAKAARRTDSDPAAETAAPQPEVEVQAAQPEAEKRPPTAAERELLKYRKILRGIEKIEAMVKSNKEKVDAMQMEKLKRRHEVELEVAKAEQKVQEEAVLLEAQAREQAAVAAREAQAAAEREVKDKAQREREARQKADADAKARALEAQSARAAEKRAAPTPKANGKVETVTTGMDLLRMVQGSAQAPQNLPPMPTPPPHALMRPQGEEKPEPPAASLPAGLPPPAARSRPRDAAASRWADASEAEMKEALPGRLDDITTYTTTLDLSKIPKEVQEKAARVAAEIEAEQTGVPVKGSAPVATKGKKGDGRGKGKDGKEPRDREFRKGEKEGGKDGGKFRDRDDRDYTRKGEKDGSPKGKGKGREMKGGFGKDGIKDDAFDDWVMQRRAIPRNV